ncbi:MAG: energy transducer TonB [Planctomycetota bacterium]
MEDPPPEAVELPAPARASPTGVPELVGLRASEGEPGVVIRAAPAESVNRAPSYPRRARAARMEGTTEVEVTVGAAGKVEQAVVSKSSGHPLLDDEALRAVKRWRFTPAQDAAGAARADRVIVPITFRIVDH